MLLPNNEKLRKYVGALIGFFIVLSGVFIYLKLIGDNSSQERIDEPSGEVISSPKNRDNEGFATDGKQITYYGISKLTKYGVSSFMTDTLRTEIQKYSVSHQNYVKSISIYVEDIKIEDNDQDTTITFNILINEKDKATIYMTYISLRDVSIVMKDASGKKTIDSGKILNSKYVSPQDEVGN